MCDNCETVHASVSVVTTRCRSWRRGPWWGRGEGEGQNCNQTHIYSCVTKSNENNSLIVFLSPTVHLHNCHLNGKG